MRTVFIIVLVLGSLLCVGTEVSARECGSNSRPPVGLEANCDVSYPDGSPNHCLIWIAPNPTNFPCLL